MLGFVVSLTTAVPVCELIPAHCSSSSRENGAICDALRLEFKENADFSHPSSLP
jgi:hypothetical protein